ncbi:MAG: phospholipid carrier-dependent glycosyltransferase [Nostocaceae cyanobacterium]|nr:phospholipid carrier-dependent glycosyltransferase [Nostocaceae cyanobacterium]
MSKKLFLISIIGVFLLSLVLRFWGLERFNTLVFDEVYYAKFGNNYLINIPFFDGHPPLAKYIIAIGIYLGNNLPFGQDTVNNLTGSTLSSWSYRWINAFSGSFIPLIVAAIAYQLSERRSFALLAGLFTACDGIFLVESRYALINQYIVIFGLLGQWLFLLALTRQKQIQQLFFILSGIAFGASIACKWNGVFFLVGTYLIWFIVWIWQWLVKDFVTDEVRDITNSSNSSNSSTLNISDNNSSAISVISRESIANNLFSPLQNLTQINLIQMLLYLGIIPVIIYSISWIPHLLLDTKYGFIEVHQQIFSFHKGLGDNSSNIHPYCAAWYKWPLMNRPMAYFYDTALTLKNPIPTFGPPLPGGTGKFIYDVHAMGNPFLWWFGITALLLLLLSLIQQIAIPSIINKRFYLPTQFSVDNGITLFLLLNYGVNLLPWVGVNRCIFIYHYMTAVVFAFLAIAWLVDRYINSYNTKFRALGITITFIIIAAFVFWMPIYLGLPLSPEDYKLRMWFNSWI